MLTKNGPLPISRNILIPADEESRNKLKEMRNASSVCPLDDALKITGLPFKITPEFMIECAYWGQHESSYHSAEEIIKRVYNIKVSDDTIRLVTNNIGKIVHDNESKEADNAFNKLETCNIPMENSKPGILYLEADGAALNTRHVNEDGSSWRENKLGIAFTSDDIKCYKNSRTGELEHRISHREYTSYLGGVSEFKKFFLALALRNGYGQYEKTVILSDGAPWISNMADEICPNCIHILDIFHLFENVSTYGKALFPNNEDKSKQWSEHTCTLLKNGKADIVLEELKTMPRPISENCVNLPNYIASNLNHINYPEYRKMGLFVGSGAIESGNKVVLQKRLKQAGMRWEPQTAQYMLALRAKSESGMWPECEQQVREFYAAA